MGQDGQHPGDDEAAMLGLLPADGSPAANDEIRRQLGWDPQRYADARGRLEDQGRVLSGRDRTVCRHPTAVPPEFRPACGRPGAHVTVRRVPVTVPHAACDLTGVSVSYPGRGGATAPARPGSVIGNTKGFRLRVDPVTLDVTITVTGPAGNP